MWGTVDLNEIELQRPSFRGKYLKDPVTGRKKKFTDKIVKEKMKRLFGIHVSLLFASLVLVAVTAIFFYRSTLDKNGMGPKFCALINAVQIQIMNQIYRRVAKFFTD